MVADIRQPTTGYVHPTDPNLLNIHKAMEYRDGLPHLRVNLGSDNITITGDVNLVDTVNLSSSTLAALETVTISNTSFAVTNFPTTSTVYQDTDPWRTTVTNWPAIQYVNGVLYAVQSGTWNVGVTGNVTVDNFTSTVNVASMPTVSGTVAISSLPAITGTVSINNSLTITNTSFAITNFPTTSTVYQGTDPWRVSGNVTVTNFTSTVNIASMPAVSGTVAISSLPAVTGTVTVSNFTSTVNVATLPAITGTVVVSNFTSTVRVDNFPTTSTVYQGTSPWTITGTVNIGTMPEVEIKNDTGNPIPISATTAANTALNPIYIAGNVSTIGGSAQGKLWTMQIAQGLIAGHTVEQVTGYNPSTSAGDAVWSAGSAYPWSSFATAQTLYLKSSTNNATDRSMSILIDGLDANYANQTEVITLNASDSRTAVVSTKQFLRIHNIQCNGADTNVGDIITTVTSGTGTVVSKISAGRGSARAGCFTIPAGYTGYLFKGDASSTAATVVNFMARYYGKAFMVVHVAIVDNSTYIYDFPFPMPLPEKTDMYCTIEAGSGKTAINYEILLVAN